MGCLFQEIEQLVLWHTPQRSDGSEGKALAHERRQRENSPAVFAEPLGAGDDGARHLMRQSKIGVRGGGDEISSPFLERVLPNQVVDNFLDEERVPLCCPAHGGG